MIDYYLKFESEQAFIDACDDAGLINEDGEIIAATEDYCMSVIGTLFNQIDDETAESLDGYHVNLRTSIETGLELFAIDVNSPKIVWSE